MKAVFTLCWGNLSKRKVQNGLIALLIAFSALLVNTALTVLIHNQSVFEQRHQDANGAHELLNMVQGLHDEQKIAQWWTEQEGVAVSSLLPYKPWTGLVFNNQEFPNLVLYMMETPRMPLLVDNLLPTKTQEILTKPEPGTVWIPTSLAYKYEMEVGDKLTFTAGPEPLTYMISAIVIDLSHGGPFTINARIWMNDTDYAQVSSVIQADEQYKLALRYDDPETSERYWQQLEQELGTPFLEEYVSYDQIYAFHFIMNKVIGFVMSFLGVVMIVVALLTIGFTITDTILANYRTIGILKSLGLTSTNIVFVYMLQYGLLSLLALVPAWLGSYFLSGVIVQSSLSFLQSESSSHTLLSPGIMLLTGASLVLIVLLCAALYAGRARKIEPLQAIRYGMSESSHSRSSSTRMGSDILERWPVTTLIGWKQLRGNKKGSLLIFLLTSISVAVLVFSSVLVSSVYRISETSPQWGYDNADVVLMVINPNELDRKRIDETLGRDPRVASLTWSGSSVGVISEPNQTAQPLSLPLTVIDGSLDEMGLANLTGRNPQLPDEIAIGINVARQLNKSIGDTLTIYLEGNPYQMLITGTFQAISNKSNTARLTIDRITNFLPDAGYIQLHQPDEAKAVVDEWKQRLGADVQILEQKVLYDSVSNEAAVILLIPMTLLALLFIGITCLIIYSTCRLHTRKEMKTYGIYSLVGLTANRIRRALTFAIAGIAVIGAGCGVLLGVHALPAILRGLLSVYGIVQLPLIVPWGLVGGLALFALIIAAYGSWLSSRLLSKSSLRMLVVE